MVADVVEAIIGSACLSGDRDLALWVSKRLKVPLPKINHWHELRSQYTFPERRHAVQLSPQTIAGVEKIIGFKFKRVDVLAEALVCFNKERYKHPVDEICFHQTHGSGNTASGYDRLEFLGDAILDFCELHQHFELCLN